MSTFFLCVSNKTNNSACMLQKGAGGLEIVFCTPPSIADEIAPLLQALDTQGVYVRQEYFAPGQINVDRVKISPEDPRYLIGCAEAFSRFDWKTLIYSSEKAKIWQKLYEFSIPDDLRATLAHQLNTLAEDALQELNDILDRAAKRASVKE